jgi:formylglycine-generating enzyme required for sulfatase activity
MLPLIVLAEGPLIDKWISAPGGGRSDAQAKGNAEVQANAEANPNAEAEAAHSKSLCPQMVSLGSFAISKYAVTFEEYDLYALATGSQQ